jgi:hypothetical protein
MSRYYYRDMFVLYCTINTCCMKKNLLLLFTLSCFTTFSLTAQVKVHTGGRYLQTADGKPFFWLADTDWELFHRLNREQIAAFLETRHQQGFNIIQAVVLAEMNGVHEPNRYGDRPFHNTDPLQWTVTPGNNPKDSMQYDYWDHIDYAVQLAAKRGLYIGLLPTWGDKVAHMWGEGPRIFTAADAAQYGKMLAQRYGPYNNIIWILGGDRPAVYKGNDQQPYDDRPIWRAMAAGIKEGEGNRHHLMTYHTWGNSNSTSQQIHDEPWLDMNTFQSGHGSREVKVWEWVRRDLQVNPPKPTADLEPCYEDHPVNPWDGKWTRQRGYFTAYDVRVRMYRSVFAGACGVTYGHHQVWQFLDTSLYKPINIGDTIIGWRKALQSPGAWQMQYLKKLLLSRPYFHRIADEQLVVSDTGQDWTNYISATRDVEGSYAMIHLPEAKPVTIDMSRLHGAVKKAAWFDPRNGKTSYAPIQYHQGKSIFTPPRGGRDWVLIIDEAGKRKPITGTVGIAP